jgi:hypothetical protein
MKGTMTIVHFSPLISTSSTAMTCALYPSPSLPDDTPVDRYVGAWFLHSVRMIGADVRPDWSPHVS